MFMSIFKLWQFMKLNNTILHTNFHWLDIFYVLFHVKLPGREKLVYFCFVLMVKNSKEKYHHYLCLSPMLLHSRCLSLLLSIHINCILLTWQEWNLCIQHYRAYRPTSYFIDLTRQLSLSFYLCVCFSTSCGFGFVLRIAMYLKCNVTFNFPYVEGTYLQHLIWIGPSCEWVVALPGLKIANSILSRLFYLLCPWPCIKNKTNVPQLTAGCWQYASLTYQHIN